MPNTNEFLPFATAGGANVISQSAYAALAARLSGFTAGEAYSNQVNKALRQAGFVAAMLGQFTADNGPSNAADDGVIANLQAAFTAAVQSVAGVPASSLVHYGADTGPANAMTVASSPTTGAYSAGLTIIVLPNNTNTGPSTVNIDSHGIKSIKRADGSVLQAGDIVSGTITVLTYDGTNFRILFSVPLAETAVVHSGTDTGSASALVVNVSPNITSYQQGSLYIIKTNAACSGGSTANLDAIGIRNVVRADGTPIQVGDWGANEVIQLLDNGTSLILYGVKTSQAPPRNRWVRSVAGTYTFVVPNGVTYIEAIVVGAGAGGGGAGGGSPRAASGGGSGGYASDGLNVYPGQTFTAVVGAKGLGGSNGDGNVAGSGGTSTFGPLTATGGVGGETSSAHCAGGPPGVGTGGSDNRYGSSGGDGNPGGNNYQGGAGGASAFGGGGRTSTLGSNHQTVANGLAPGSGGGGIWGASSDVEVGGNGCDGSVQIRY